MNTKYFRRQNGAIDFTRAIFILLGVSAVSYGAYDYQRSEVVPEEYNYLHSQASKSCAGQAYLKQRVSAGPITNWSKSGVASQLHQFQDAQSVSDVKAKILGATVACTQPTKEQQ
jgi:hypothetical protein